MDLKIRRVMDLLEDTPRCYATPVTVAVDAAAPDAGTMPTQHAAVHAAAAYARLRGAQAGTSRATLGSATSALEAQTRRRYAAMRRTGERAPATWRTPTSKRTGAADARDTAASSSGASATWTPPAARNRAQTSDSAVGAGGGAAGEGGGVGDVEAMLDRIIERRRATLRPRAVKAIASTEIGDELRTILADIHGNCSSS